MNFSIDHLSHDKKTAYALFFGVVIIASFFYLSTNPSPKSSGAKEV